MKNVIFLTHAEKGPSGGAKYIYRFSEIINNIDSFSSEIIHIKKKKISKYKNTFNKFFFKKKKIISGWQINDITVAKNFRYNWFKNHVNLKQNLIFDKKKDFVILPEIFAHLAEKLLMKKKINYAILVQNGYSINSTNNEKILQMAYKNAKFILSISKDTSNCIQLRFPKIKKRILKLLYCINLNKVNFYKKKNIITYMDRKLSQHSNLVMQYLRTNLKKNWKIKNLQNLSEKKTFVLLKQSKIFLSFSNLEGFGLPPVEAAMAGNTVIGYTGEGGNEYWKKPLFIKINSGEINKFVKTIIQHIKNDRNKKKFLKKHINLLRKKFSKDNELHSIKNLLKLV
jgi:glycosyltransferase involved in cell wall biosynthesis